MFLIPNIMSHCTLDQMKGTEAGNLDDATSKTTHLKSTMVICIYVVMNVIYLPQIYDTGIKDQIHKMKHFNSNMFLREKKRSL